MPSRTGEGHELSKTILGSLPTSPGDPHQGKARQINFQALLPSVSRSGLRASDAVTCVSGTPKQPDHHFAGSARDRAALGLGRGRQESLPALDVHARPFSILKLLSLESLRGVWGAHSFCGVWGAHSWRDCRSGCETHVCTMYLQKNKTSIWWCVSVSSTCWVMIRRLNGDVVHDVFSALHCMNAPARDVEVLGMVSPEIQLLRMLSFGQKMPEATTTFPTEPRQETPSGMAASYPYTSCWLIMLKMLRIKQEAVPEASLERSKPARHPDANTSHE